VLEHVSEAVLVLDRQRNLQFVNERACRLLGFEDGQPVGSRCRLTTRRRLRARLPADSLESRLDHRRGLRDEKHLPGRHGAPLA
jgi:PAS domain-containing protein